MKKYTKGFIAGTFDNFHVGHQWLLWQAVHRVDELVVIVARDQTVLRIKKSLPKNSQEKRRERILQEFLPNSTVRMGRKDADFLQTLKDEDPDILFLGYDQRFDEEKSQEFFPDLSVVRLDPFFPGFFKSSLF